LITYGKISFFYSMKLFNLAVCRRWSNTKFRHVEIDKFDSTRANVGEMGYFF
jgi:hypothetical protein